MPSVWRAGSQRRLNRAQLLSPSGIDTIQRTLGSMLSRWFRVRASTTRRTSKFAGSPALQADVRGMAGTGREAALRRAPSARGPTERIYGGEHCLPFQRLPFLKWRRRVARFQFRVRGGQAHSRRTAQARVNVTAISYGEKPHHSQFPSARKHLRSSRLVAVVSSACTRKNLRLLPIIPR